MEEDECERGGGAPSPDPIPPDTVAAVSQPPDAIARNIPLSQPPDAIARNIPLSQKPSRHIACYLLRSLSSPQCVYIGYTNEPARRLRQHNGEIKNGALKTSRKRPWEMILCVWNFPNRVAGLQFEWAWQHPGSTRILPGTAKGVNKTVEMAAKLVCENESPFGRMPIKFHFMDSTAKKIFEKSLSKNIPHIEISLGSLSDLPHSNVLGSPEIDRNVPHMCPICGVSIYVDVWILTCDACGFLFHPCCLAMAELGHGRELIPRSVECRICLTTLQWPMLVQGAKRYVKSDGGYEAC
eukprot:GHVO01041000.1.p1 GENE.GHVO01041000.1~~GHVO01041000.1.p1  ORF type:complete len:296 (-),score=75.08 GHVO01041000.1:233-1120(-)